MNPVERTHGNDLKWLTEMLEREEYSLLDCHTDVMAADIFTKYPIAFGLPATVPICTTGAPVACRAL